VNALLRLEALAQHLSVAVAFSTKFFCASSFLLAVYAAVVRIKALIANVSSICSMQFHI
jgi:hypothetical protein